MNVPNLSTSRGVLLLTAALLSTVAAGQPDAIRGRLSFKTVTETSDSRTTLTYEVQGVWRAQERGSGCMEKPLGKEGEGPRAAVFSFAGVEGSLSYTEDYEDLYRPTEEELKDPQFLARARRKTHVSSKRVAIPAQKFDEGQVADPLNFGNLGCLHFDPVKGQFAYEPAWFSTQNNTVEISEQVWTELTFGGTERKPTPVRRAINGSPRIQPRSFERAARQLRDAFREDNPNVEEGARQWREASYELTLPGSPEVVVEIRDYASWMPSFRKDGSPRTLTVVARAVAPDGQPWKPGVVRFTFELDDVSQVPGRFLNDDNQDTTDDFAFLAEENRRQAEIFREGRGLLTWQNNFREFSAELTPRDSGGWATLRVKAELFNGSEVQAHLKGEASTREILLPRRHSNGAHVAAPFLSRYDLPIDADEKADAEETKGNPNLGDGLTLYDEYRGIWDGSKVVRFHPRFRDLVVENNLKDAALPAFEVFEKATGLRVVPVQRLPSNRIFTAPGARPQTGLRLLEDASIQGSDGTFGVTARDKRLDLDGRSPRGALTIKVAPRANAPGRPEDRDRYYAVAVAHELGHGVGLSHHGEGGWKEVIRLDGKNAYDTDGKPMKFYEGRDAQGPYRVPVIVPHTASYQRPPSETVIHLGVAKAPSTSSGDSECLMIYRDVFEFAPRADGKFQRVKKVGPIPAGREHLCASLQPAGDPLNASLFGEADPKTAPCAMRARVRDFDP